MESFNSPLIVNCYLLTGTDFLFFILLLFLKCLVQFFASWIVNFKIVFLLLTVWEINTGRCLKTIKLDGIITCVKWCPSTALSLVAVAAEENLYIINPGLGDYLVSTKTDSVFEEPPPLEGLGMSFILKKYL